MATRKENLQRVLGNYKVHPTEYLSKQTGHAKMEVKPIKASAMLLCCELVSRDVLDLIGPTTTVSQTTSFLGSSKETSLSIS